MIEDHLDGAMSFAMVAVDHGPTQWGIERLVAAIDSLCDAIREQQREINELKSAQAAMTTKQKDHLAAAFDRGFPGEALR